VLFHVLMSEPPGHVVLFPSRLIPAVCVCALLTCVCVCVCACLVCSALLECVCVLLESVCPRSDSMCVCVCQCPHKKDIGSVICERTCVCVLA